MKNATAADVVPLDHRHEGFGAVVSDLASLIDRVQASIKLIETAQGQQPTADTEPADVVVLDDVTPRYAQASAALKSCNESLTAALQFLIESTAATPRT